MTACKHGIIPLGPGFGATVTIFSRDGSVAVTQGGVEMGQGLYTKVSWVVPFLKTSVQFCSKL